MRPGQRAPGSAVAIAVAREFRTQFLARCGATRAVGEDRAGEWLVDDVEVFRTSAPAVNLISNSFFYVDRIVKDMKLGEAAGITLANVCGTVNEPCLREVELRYADHASFAIRANLVALRQGVSGTTPSSDGPGFDD